MLLGEHIPFGRADTKLRETAVTCHGGFRFYPVLVANCYELTRDFTRGRSLGLAHNIIIMTVQLTHIYRRSDNAYMTGLRNTMMMHT